MSLEFESVSNYFEQPVFDAVHGAAAAYPEFDDCPDLLTDVVCVALNRLPPRYVRFSVDLSFYQSESERHAIEQAIADAVEYAFEFIRASKRALR